MDYYGKKRVNCLRFAHPAEADLQASGYSQAGSGAHVQTPQDHQESLGGYQDLSRSSWSPPGGSQEPRGRLQEHPRRLLEGPRTLLEVPRNLLEGPRSLLGEPRSIPGEPKRLPGGEDDPATPPTWRKYRCHRQSRDHLWRKYRSHRQSRDHLPWQSRQQPGEPDPWRGVGGRDKSLRGLDSIGIGIGLDWIGGLLVLYTP